MDQKLICSNPNCGKIYSLLDKDSDPDFCSFDCWEKINCKEPPKVLVEDIIIP
jgi:hypothetical protein